MLQTGEGAKGFHRAPWGFRQGSTMRNMKISARNQFEA